MELESPEYEPINWPILACEICMSNIKSKKNITPVANNKAITAKEIIVPLSSFLFIINDLLYVYEKIITGTPVHIYVLSKRVGHGTQFRVTKKPQNLGL